jgi:hypothetical protein
MGKAASKKSFFFPIFHFSLFLPGFRFSWADPEMILEKKSDHSKSPSASCPTT